MMAYLRDYPTCQYHGCTRIAAVTVNSFRNEPYGDFCKSHGNSELKRLQKREDDYHHEAQKHL